MSRQGILMGMMPSRTRLRSTWAPTATSSLRVIWISRVMVAPFWTRIGKGVTDITSKVIGSGLPSEKDSHNHNSSTKSAFSSPQNPYSSSVGGARRFSLMSLAEAAATRKARAKNFMLRPRWTLVLCGPNFYLLFQEISISSVRDFFHSNWGT